MLMTENLKFSKWIFNGCWAIWINFVCLKNRSVKNKKAGKWDLGPYILLTVFCVKTVYCLLFCVVLCDVTSFTVWFPFRDIPRHILPFPLISHTVHETMHVSLNMVLIVPSSWHYSLTYIPWLPFPASNLLSYHGLRWLGRTVDQNALTA